MRLPHWLRTSRTRTTGRTVEVTLELDTSAFEDAMYAAAERVSVARYRRRVAHERSLGLAYVGVKLDRMCYDLGLNPVKVWRMPRQREEQEREWRERDRRDSLLYAYQQIARLAVETRKPSIIDGGGVA